MNATILTVVSNFGKLPNHELVARLEVGNISKGIYDEPPFKLIMDSKQASEYLRKNLSKIKDFTYIEEPDNGECLIGFELETVEDMRTYMNIPNSAVFIQDGRICEFDIRIGEIRNLSVDELDTIASTSDISSGMRSGIDVHNGGKINESILHICNRRLSAHPDDFVSFFNSVVSKISREIDIEDIK